MPREGRSWLFFLCDGPGLGFEPSVAMTSIGHCCDCSCPHFQAYPGWSAVQSLQ
jgi:hypothetical protein